jgi:cobyrinic acid a,c-diamide synthase
MSIIIAGVSSGVGKTTITLSLLSTLINRGFKVQSFKVGPDFIDPMFHSYVTGRSCRNLDPILTSENYVQYCFSHNLQGADCAVIEGVMGLFDGTNNNLGSTANVAKILNLPVILVIDCAKLSGSVAAIASGFLHFDPEVNLAGVILNRVGSDRHLELLEEALLPLNIPILGVFKRENDISIPDRHLGLIPTGELPNFDQLITRLIHLGKSCFNWDLLLPLVKVINPISPKPSPTKEENIYENYHNCNIAVALDQAFNFYYQDNLEILEKLGAKLIYWSPLKDQLPENIQRLYFGGGFPEMFAEELAENITAKTQVKQAILQGIPTYSECGGLMYLCQEIIDFEQRSHPMVNVLPTTAIMSKKLTLGYRQAKVLENSCLVSTGMTIKGHEFHRSHLSNPPEKPIFAMKGYGKNPQIITEGWRIKNLHSSYLHIHWGTQINLARKFIEKCQS